MSWRTLGWALVVGVWAAVPSSAIAQSDFHHVHLTVSDAEEAAQWYITHMECEPRWRSQPVEGSANRALCGSVYVLFFEGDSLGPSQGTGVDHIGFSFDDLDAKHASLEAAGVSLREDGVREVPGLFKVAILTDPWGTKVELVEHEGFDGFHHVHLASPNPDQTLAWYHEMFGGERTQMLGAREAVLYGGKVWLMTFQAPSDWRSKRFVAPTPGRAVDHLGFSFQNLDSALAELKNKGVEVTMEPRDIESPTGARIAFVTGPDEVRVEIVQPPK